MVMCRKQTAKAEEPLRNHVIHSLRYLTPRNIPQVEIYRLGMVTSCNGLGRALISVEPQQGGSVLAFK